MVCLLTVVLASAAFAQDNTPILRPQKLLNISARLLPNSHQVTLVPRGTLSPREFDGGIFIVECLIRDPEWVSADNAKGTICTTGKQEWDMIMCLAQYTNPAEKSDRCKSQIAANWTKLNAIQYKIDLGQHDGSGGFFKKKATQGQIDLILASKTGVEPQFEGKTDPGYIRQDNFQNNGQLTIDQGDVFRMFTDTDPNLIIPHWYYAVGYSSKVSNLVPANTTQQNSLKVSDQPFHDTSGLTPDMVEFDPYGYVFDATTLEPLNDMSVYLFEKNDRWTPKECLRSSGSVFSNNFSQECQPILNPVTRTDAQGSFAFVVKPGSYALDVFGTSPPAEVLRSYTQRDASSVLMSVSEQISRIKYGKKVGTIYKVVVPVDGDQKDLYTELYPQTLAGIEQIDEPPGLVQRRDIPIDASKLGVNTNRPVSQRTQYTVIDNANGMYVFGLVTHPYTQISARIESTVVAVGRVNEKGAWSITIPAASIISASPIEIDFIKPDFYGDPAAQARKIKGLRTVSATSISTITIDPHPRYIDAIAQSVSGQVMPGTLVSVYDEFIGDVVYETKSDILGRYQIPPSALPRMGYHLLYSQPGSTEPRVVTVGQLLSENAIYTSTKKVDMFSTDQAVLVQESLKASNSAIVATPMLKDPGTSKTAPGANTEVTQGSDGKTSASSAQLFTYLALLIMLVVVTILMVVFYIKRHREPHLYDATDTAGMQ